MGNRALTTRTFEQGKDEVAALVRHFANNRAAYHEANYKEAHATQEFIDPFFAAARANYFRFAEYPDRWCEIWDLFSREAVSRSFLGSGADVSLISARGL